MKAEVSASLVLVKSQTAPAVVLRTVSSGHRAPVLQDRWPSQSRGWNSIFVLTVFLNSASIIYGHLLTKFIVVRRFCSHLKVGLLRLSLLLNFSSNTRDPWFIWPVTQCSEPMCSRSRCTVRLGSVTNDCAMECCPGALRKRLVPLMQCICILNLWKTDHKELFTIWMQQKKSTDITPALHGEDCHSKSTSFFSKHLT